jgi:hypothetical protein
MGFGRARTVVVARRKEREMAWRRDMSRKSEACVWYAVVWLEIRLTSMVRNETTMLKMLVYRHWMGGWHTGMSISCLLFIRFRNQRRKQGILVTAFPASHLVKAGRVLC